MAPHRKTLLIFSQTFVPDPASVGQHMADVAVEMARRGYRVKVYTSARGYDDPTQRYPKRENVHGVEVRRLAFSSFGKKSILTRVIGTASFMTQCLFLALLTPNVAGIFFSTSPPLIGIVAAIARFIRRIPIAYWAMDLNPDQLIALGKLRPTDFLARLLERVNRIILNSSALVVALDRFMAERPYANARRRGGRRCRSSPWPHEGTSWRSAAPDQEPLPRKTLGSMTGSWSCTAATTARPIHWTPCWKATRSSSVTNPDSTLPLHRPAASAKGTSKGSSRTMPSPTSSHCPLPAPPADCAIPSRPPTCTSSRSAATWSASSIPARSMAPWPLAAPSFTLVPGPRTSPTSSMPTPIGQQESLTETPMAGMIAAIERLSTLPPETLRQMRAVAQDVLASRLSQSILCGRFCDHLEQALRLKPLPVRSPAAEGKLTTAARRRRPDAIPVGGPRACPTGRTRSSTPGRTNPWEEKY